MDGSPRLWLTRLGRQRSLQRRVGVTMIAGPLLVAQLTGDPGLVAGAAFVHQLPWLLLASSAARTWTKLDRHHLVIVVDLGRSAALAALAAAVVTDSVAIPLVYAVFFLLGTGERFVDTAYAAIVPTLVPDPHLERAIARLIATLRGRRPASPPSPWAPTSSSSARPCRSGFDAMTFLVAAALLTASRWRPRPRDPAQTVATASAPTLPRVCTHSGSDRPSGCWRSACA